MGTEEGTAKGNDGMGVHARRLEGAWRRLKIAVQN